MLLLCNVPAFPSQDLVYSHCLFHFISFHAMSKSLSLYESSMLCRICSFTISCFVSFHVHNHPFDAHNHCSRTILNHEWQICKGRKKKNNICILCHALVARNPSESSSSLIQRPAPELIPPSSMSEPHNHFNTTHQLFRQIASVSDALKPRFRP